MTGRTVVITGLGVISPLGLTAVDHHEALVAGRSAASVAEDPRFGSAEPHLEAAVRGFDRRGAVTNRMLRKLLSPSAGFAVAAAGEALADAGLRGDAEALKKCGLYVGSLSLEIDPEVFIPPLRQSLTPDGRFDISMFAQRGIKALDPLFLVRALPNAGACGISVEHQVLGPNTNITNGTTSGIGAVALAASAIRRGEADQAIAGGYDTLLGMDSVAEHLIAGRLSRGFQAPAQACRPFDRERDGYVLGEGAAFLVLEAADAAAGRGARPYAHLGPFGRTSDAAVFNADSADGSALEQAARVALNGREGTTYRIGAVLGDGIGTVEDDLREAEVFSRLLPAHPAVPFSAATPATGFTGAASGVLSLVDATLALRAGTLHALPCRDPDPRCRVHTLSSAGPLAEPRILVWNSDRGSKNVAVTLEAVDA